MFSFTGSSNIGGGAIKKKTQEELDSERVVLDYSKSNTQVEE